MTMTVTADTEVSIHSRPPGREKPRFCFHLLGNLRFQSTPAHQDGRNVLAVLYAIWF